jgi:hypothetical protein
LTRRFVVAILSITSVAFAETALWEPGKVISVEQVSTPAKTPDPDCRNVPRGGTPPEHCRPAYLRAEQFWRVTVEAGNKRYVVRPYRAPKLIDTLSQDGPKYVDPKLTAGSAVEVAVYSSKIIRLRADQGDGLPAAVDSQEIISGVVVSKAAPPQQEVAVRAAASPIAQASAADPVQSEFKIVLLDNGDFIDLEAQELKAQDIGDGAALYSFAGDSSRVRVSSNKPVFMILGASDATNSELSRLQVGKGTRELVYSQIRKKSASAVPVTVTRVSDTLRRVAVNEPLGAGEYVLIVPGSGRAFLFGLH